MAYPRCTLALLRRSAAAYKAHGCNLAVAAKALDIGRTTLQHRIAEYERRIGPIARPATDAPLQSPPQTASDICALASSLTGGDRARTHGDKVENHRNIAALWNAYLGWRLDEGCALKPADVALMMVLLKVARTKSGAFNIDDYVDLAGYGGVAGEIATQARKTGAPP